jgi:hypothetical protein
MSIKAINGFNRKQAREGGIYMSYLHCMRMSIVHEAG